MNDSNEKEDNLGKFDTTDKTYSLDRKIDYFTVRSMVIRSLENIVREELNRHIASISLHKIIDGIQEDDEENIIIANNSTNNSILITVIIYLTVRMTTTINYQHHY